jgi:hypothetical protein
MKTSRYEEGDEAGPRHPMPMFPDDPARRFLEYYRQYLIAKGRQNREMIWFCAVVCRMELRKIHNALRRSDEAFLDGLGAQRTPDSTTSGDFARRFGQDSVLGLMESDQRCARGGLKAKEIQ